jgi:dihydrolipoamide dehydrogenase
MLAHKASREAEVAAEVIAGHKSEFDVRSIPAVIFSDPEVATAGITADEATAKGRKVKVGKFPFVALGRAIANADTDGFVKVVITRRRRGGPLRGRRRLTSSPRPRSPSRWAPTPRTPLTIHAHPPLRG